MLARKWIPILAALAFGASACALILDLQDRELGPDDGGSTSDVGTDDGGGNGDAALDATSTCDGNFTSDPLNCGRCAHSCVGGACDAGVCEQVTIPTTGEIVNPTAIAVLGDDVYWVESGDPYPDGGHPPGSVWFMKKSGGTPTRLYLDDAGSTVDSLSAGDTIYWTSELPSLDVPVHTPSGIYCVAPDLTGTASLLAPAAGGVYVGQPANYSFDTCVMGGGVIANAGYPLVSGMAHAGNLLLVGMASGLFGHPSPVWLCPDLVEGDASSCNVNFGSTPGAGGVAYMALSSTRAFWSSGPLLTWKATAADAGLAAITTEVDASPLALAAAEDPYLFVASAASDQGPGALFSFVCDETGCGSQQAMIVDYPTALTFDDDALYLAVARPLADGGTSGAIIKIAKP